MEVSLARDQTNKQIMVKKLLNVLKCFKVIITSIIFLDGDEMLMICQAVASMIPTCSPWLAKMTESIAK